MLSPQYKWKSYNHPHKTTKGQDCFQFSFVHREDIPHIKRSDLLIIHYSMSPYDFSQLYRVSLCKSILLRLFCTRTIKCRGLLKRRGCKCIDFDWDTLKYNSPVALVNWCVALTHDGVAAANRWVEIAAPIRKRLVESLAVLAAQADYELLPTVRRRALKRVVYRAYLMKTTKDFLSSKSIIDSSLPGSAGTRSIHCCVVWLSNCSSSLPNLTTTRAILILTLSSMFWGVWDAQEKVDWIHLYFHFLGLPLGFAARVRPISKCFWAGP